MLFKICLGIFILSLIGAIVESLVLERNITSSIVAAITATITIISGSIMTLTVVNMEKVNQSEKR